MSATATPRYSVVSAASRPLPVLKRLREQFRAQTIADFEHVIVYDGPPPNDVKAYFEAEAATDARVRFEWLADKDGRYGTAPRNHGIELSRGTRLVFADDDDLYHPDFLKAFDELSLDDRTLGVVRMNNYGTVVPRHPLRDFPRECHVGTPNCCFATQWFRDDPHLRWDDDGTYSHDYALVRRCIERAKPLIRLNPRVVVKAANERILAEQGFTGTRRESYLGWTQPNAWLRAFDPARDDRPVSRMLYDLGSLLGRVSRR